MTGIFAILACWCAGNLLSMLIGGYVSGNIIGMVLLYAALHFRIVKAADVAPTAKFLLRTMALFFVPFGVGLMVSYHAIADNLPAIVVASVVSTALVIAVIGLVYQKMNKRV